VSKLIHLPEPQIPACVQPSKACPDLNGDGGARQKLVMSARAHPQRILQLTIHNLILVPNVGITKNKNKQIKKKPTTKKTPKKTKNKKKHRAHVKENLKSWKRNPLVQSTPTPISFE